ncbi:MAG: hypothetical protein JNL69_00025 [Bacteroidia bacterium]|nr:hypothetical protein [Bacteroidia bacterium]
MKIFFVLRNSEEGWKTTNRSIGIELFKVKESLLKIKLSEKETLRLNENEAAIIELKSKRWISLIRLFILFVIASISLLIFSSVGGFYMKKYSSTSGNEIESMSFIKNKIDSLALKIDANQLDRNIEFDSLRYSFQVLEAKISNITAEGSSKRAIK